jgi:hypothetical protein
MIPFKIERATATFPSGEVAIRIREPAEAVLSEIATLPGLEVVDPKQVESITPLIHGIGLHGSLSVVSFRVGVIVFVALNSIHIHALRFKLKTSPTIAAPVRATNVRSLFLSLRLLIIQIVQ